MKRMRGIFRKHRRGVALPTVLLIAMFGAIVVAAIFEISTRFGLEDIVFRETYKDQVTASGFVEQLKGRISAKIAADELALHAGNDLDLWETGVIIESLDDLKVELIVGSGDVLNFDTTVQNRRVEVRTYDLTYKAANVKPGLSEAIVAQLPAPLELASVIFDGNQTGVENDGLTDVGGGGGGPGGIALSLRYVGAYLVRVRIFHPDGRLARTTEESFFILARNASTTNVGAGEG